MQSILPDFITGGRRKFDVMSSVLSIVEAAEQGSYVGSLDYTKAFDHVRPDKAEAVLAFHGCPNALAKALGSLWASQERLLVFASVVLPSLQSAGSSLPQGDPRSVLSHSLRFRIPGLKIPRYFDPLQINFVDDRS